MSDNIEGGICCPMNGYLEQWLKHAGNVKDSNDWSDSSATGLRRMEAACHALDADYAALLGCSSINRNKFMGLLCKKVRKSDKRLFTLLCRYLCRYLETVSTVSGLCMCFVYTACVQYVHDVFTACTTIEKCAQGVQQCVYYKSFNVFSSSISRGCVHLLAFWDSPWTSGFHKLSPVVICSSSWAYSMGLLSHLGCLSLAGGDLSLGLCTFHWKWIREVVSQVHIYNVQHYVAHRLV